MGKKNRNAFQLKADHPRTRNSATTRIHQLHIAKACFYCSCDLDIDPMTLIYELDVKILKMYLFFRNRLKITFFPITSFLFSVSSSVQYTAHSGLAALYMGHSK